MTAVDDWVREHEAELIGVRRHIHAHPELAFAEHETTALVREALEEAGLAPKALPNGTGLVCDLGPDDSPAVLIRADLDALPLTDENDVAYRSTVPGVSHACGHDVHTAALLGAGLALAELDRDGQLPHRVRLVFQPAEETIPGGALEVLASGALEDVAAAYALHCDPRVEVGRIATKAGAITAACDSVAVRLTGPGGHTARPHLTADLVYALGDVITRVPALLARRVDPRVGMSLVWGRVTAGATHNVIPQTGGCAGTVRTLDRRSWDDAPALVKGFIDTVLAPYRLSVDVDYKRGLPPVMNDPDACRLVTRVAESALGPGAVVATEQSLGGEDFAWYVEKVPGALIRLGTRTPGDDRELDLHRGTFDVDERAVAVGVKVFVAVATAPLAQLRAGRHVGGA